MARKKGTPTSPFVPVEEQPYPIPENWCYFYFTSLIDVEGGTQPPKSQFVDTCKDGYIRLVQIRDFATDKYTVYVPDTPKMRHFNENDIMIARYGASLGRICTGLKGVYNVALAKTIFSNDILYRRYVYWMLQSESFQAPLLRISRTAQAGFNKDDLSTFAMPLPPYAEQKRIVDRIESLFAKLDEAKEKAQAVVEGFELRKSAILHKAFTGELTERWRKEHGVGLDSWKQAILMDVLKEKPRNGYSPKPVNYVTPYKSMTLSATTSGVFKDEYFKYIDEEIPEDSYLWLKPGDILIQRANSLDKVGTSAIYTGREHEFIYPDLMMKLQVAETASPQFVAYSLKRDDSLAYFRANATGTAGNMPKINQKVVSQTPLNLPTFDEQIEIVRILENLFVKEQQAKEAAEAVLDHIDTMKKAILARAFRGELGTNDPAEEWAGELVREILKTEVPPQPRARAVFIPKEFEKRLESELERKIIKLYLKSDSATLSIDVLMAVSSKKFEVMDALRNLEQRGIIKKLNNGNYSLVR